MPCAEGSVEDASRICRHKVLQAGGWLGVPRWCPAPHSVGRHYRLPQKQINASPPSLPPCFPPAPRTTSVATGEGARGAPGGAGTQVPVTCSRRQLGWRRMGLSSLVSLIRFSCLTGGGSGPCRRGSRFLKTTAICKAERVDYLQLLEIVF